MLFNVNTHHIASLPYLCKKLLDRAKTPSESLTILTDLVLPSETNYLDNLFGGELLARMDRACSSAQHSRRIVVTASVNHVAFNKSVPVGSVVTIEAKVSKPSNPQWKSM